MGTFSQFLGWPWGKFRRPAEAARFHVVMFVCIVVGATVPYTGVDPIMVTEYSVVFSAIALPLTYLPILIVANDSEYMGAEPPQVTSLLAGHVVATRIFGGEPPRSQLQEIPWNLIASVGVVVRLKPTEMTIDSGWIERWLRDQIIKHIPGGRHAAE